MSHLSPTRLAALALLALPLATPAWANPGMSTPNTQPAPAPAPAPAFTPRSTFQPTSNYTNTRTVQTNTAATAPGRIYGPMTRRQALEQNLAQSRLEQQRAQNWAAAVNGATAVAEGANVAGQVAQTGLAVVPGMGPVGVGLDTARGAAEGFGQGWAEGKSWGQIGSRTLIGAGTSGGAAFVTGKAFGRAETLTRQGMQAFSQMASGTAQTTVNRLVRSGVQTGAGVVGNLAGEAVESQLGGAANDYLTNGPHGPGGN